MMKKRFSFFFCALLFLCICLGGVCAASKEAQTERTEEEIMEQIRERGGSIVRVESICWNGEDTVYAKRSFSGFVVSGDTTGIHIVTVQNGLSYSSAEKEKVKEKYSLENNARILEKMEVVFGGDLRVEAESVGESDQRGLAVLKLKQNIHFEDTLSFRTNGALDKESIYLLSFPKPEDGEKAVYNAENAAVFPGTVQKLYRAEEISFFGHDIKADSCCAGGPLLDVDGHIVGVLLTPAGKKNGTAISGEDVMEFLDTLNVEYGKYQEVAEEKKLPIVNIILGVIIAVLAVTVLVRQVQGMSGQEKDVPNPGEVGKRKVSPKPARSGKEKAGSGPMRFGKEKTSSKSPQFGMDGSGAPMGASLEYTAEKRFVMIRKQEFIIGRLQEADFSLSECKGISRKHASVRFDGKNYYLSDLHSTNRTYLNGREVAPGGQVLLSDGDEITVGNEKLIFHNGK